MATMGNGGTPTVVLLGASNVQMGRRGLVAEALGAVGARAEVFVAAGHGRSYGDWSRVLVRGLPGIVHCGLWTALEASASAGPGFALLSDIGNDLAYGTTPERLAGWVERCVERLQEREMRVAVSLFPQASVAGLGSWRFWLLRSLLFPGRVFSRQEILARGAELNERLRALAGRLDFAWLEPEAGWFGLDGIHLRPAARQAAWRAMVAAWRVSAGAETPALASSLRLGAARPELCTFLGRERRTAQPCAVLPGGGSVSFF
jgi:hypothetical protein